jgi:serine/threonine protein kinase
MWGSDVVANTSAALVFRPGTVIAGKFRVDRVIAEGGMAIVVAATHLHLEQPVALKFLRGDISSDWDALARFTREAQAAAQLKSEHVARVLDVGMTEDGAPYIVMEYLEGHSLAEQLEKHGALEVASAVEYAIQTCEGLAEAHARGIVHRDIKPENLFLVERAPGWRSIKILDFGISKVALAAGANVSTGIIMGSPCYMSPEQLRSTASVDHRSDIWSLGATLHELLTGTHAFDPSQSLPALVAAILEAPVAPLRQLRPEVPEELAAIVAGCLTKQREQRFQSAAELAMALLPYAPSRARVPAERASSMTTSSRISKPIGEDTVPVGESPKSPASANGESGRLEGTLPLSEGPPPLALNAPSEAAPQNRFRSARRVGSIAAFAVLATVLLLLSRRGSAPEVATGAPPIRPVEPPLPTAPAATPPPELSTLVVRVSPSSAQIVIDGVPVVGNPFSAHYLKDETHEIRALAIGYEPKTRKVSTFSDQVIEMNLDRRPGMSQPRSVGSSSSARVAQRTPAGSPAQPNTTTAPAVLVPLEIDPAGGKAPRRPIDARNPYESP